MHYEQQGSVFVQRSTFKKILVLDAIVSLGIVLLIVGYVLSRPVKQTPPDTKIDPKGPNIVLIVMDAFRQDRLGANRNGVPLTPFLDSLQSEAAVFSNAVTACTWTRPAMASLYTSLYVYTHQVIFNEPVLAESDISDALSPTLPIISTILKDAGYHTVGIQANGNLFPEFGFHRGFDIYRTALDAKGSLLTDWAIQEVDRTVEPFFLYVHYMDPHLPYDPPQEYRDIVGYTAEGLTAAEREIVENFREYYMEHCKAFTGRTTGSPFAALSPAGMEGVKALYDAEIRYTDEEVRHLVEHVRQKDPNTVFIVLADHGEHFWDHGLLGHGLSLYDCEVRIPLLLFGGDVKGGVFEQPVEIIDILPTVAKLTGVAPMQGWQGSDLFSRQEKPLFSKTRGPSPAWNTHLEMVISAGKKMILNRGNDTVQLYAWPGDPEEKDELSAAFPEEVRRLKSIAGEQMRRNHALISGAAGTTVMDEETREQLRRLGYME